MNKYLNAISANLIFFLISTVFFLAITSVAIHVMGEEFYGLWAILTALMLLSNVGAAGIEALVVKFSSEAVNEEGAQIQRDQVVTAGYIIILMMAVVMAVGLLLARNLIADNLHIDPEFSRQFRVAIFWVTAGLFPQFLSRVPQGYLNGRLQNQTTRSIDLFWSILIWVGAILITLVGKNLIHLAIWCFLTNTLTFILYWWTLRRRKVRFHLHMPTLTRMLHFSGWMFLQSVATALFQQFDRVIVGFTLGHARKLPFMARWSHLYLRYSAGVADAEAKTLYTDAAKAKGKPVFSLTIADFPSTWLRTSFNAPSVDEVDLSAYTGAVGDEIVIMASDDFNVEAVGVALTDDAGNPLALRHRSCREHAGAEEEKAVWVLMKTSAKPYQKNNLIFCLPVNQVNVR